MLSFKPTFSLSSFTFIKWLFSSSSLSAIASACNARDPGSIPGSGRSDEERIGYPLQYSCASLVAQLVKNLQCRRPGFDPWVGKIPWRRERLPTPVFWPGEFHGLCSVYSPWGHKESDTTERLSVTALTQMTERVKMCEHLLRAGLQVRYAYARFSHPQNEDASCTVLIRDEIKRRDILKKNSLCQWFP